MKRIGFIDGDGENRAHRCAVRNNLTVGIGTSYYSDGPRIEVTADPDGRVSVRVSADGGAERAWRYLVIDESIADLYEHAPIVEGAPVPPRSDEPDGSLWGQISDLAARIVEEGRS